MNQYRGRYEKKPANKSKWIGILLEMLTDIVSGVITYLICKLIK
jgi:hypothetical protein